MKQFKKALALVFVLAMVAAVLPQTTAGAKKTKSVSLSASLQVGETLKLGAIGGKSYKWSTSKKKVATVTSKGVVTAVGAGSAVITAKDTKSKKKASITIKVAKPKEFVINGIDVEGSGSGFTYTGDDLSESTILIDGQEVKMTFYEREYDGVTYRSMYIKDDTVISDGDHTFVARKIGYKDFTYKFSFENKFVVDYFLSENDGALAIMFNRDVDGQNLVVKVDGNVVKKSAGYEGVNGDGVYVFLIDLALLSTPGEHTISASADNHAEESFTFTV